MTAKNSRKSDPEEAGLVVEREPGDVDLAAGGEDPGRGPVGQTARPHPHPRVELGVERFHHAEYRNFTFLTQIP